MATITSLPPGLYYAMRNAGFDDTATPADVAASLERLRRGSNPPKRDTAWPRDPHYLDPSIFNFGKTKLRKVERWLYEHGQLPNPDVAPTPKRAEIIAKLRKGVALKKHERDWILERIK